MAHARHVFLTGKPGVGKTTLAVAAVKALNQSNATVQTNDDDDEDVDDSEDFVKQFFQFCFEIVYMIHIAKQGSRLLAILIEGFNL
jgi:MoxR-like ATPase